MITNKLLINNNKMWNVLHDILNRYSETTYKKNTEYLDDKNILLLLYILHKIGINLDLYSKLKVDLFKAFLIKNKDYKYIMPIVQTVRFGRFIGQEIPDNFRIFIYGLVGYDNIKLLDQPVTEDEINDMIKKVK